MRYLAVMLIAMFCWLPATVQAAEHRDPGKICLESADDVNVVLDFEFKSAFKMETEVLAVQVSGYADRGQEVALSPPGHVYLTEFVKNEKIKNSKKRQRHWRDYLNNLPSYVVYSFKSDVSFTFRS